MKAGKLIAICLLFAPLFGWSQDVHFSQIFAQPMLTNPANTGNFNGLVRVGLNYRDQWGSVTVPYKTFDLYSDLAIQPKGASNRFGLGLLVLGDEAGDGILTTNKAYMTAAYHIGYDDAATYRFSFGLMGGWVQKRVDYNKLTFDSQWDEHEFNTDLSNNEESAGGTLSYLDFAAGGMLSIIPYEGEKYFFGVSAAHLNRPSESFYGSDNRLGIRTNAVAGAFFPVGKKASLQPQLYFQTEKAATEIIGGANCIFPLASYNDAHNSVFGGAWYRYQDAAWFVAGCTFGNLTFSASYDVNMSKLTEASSGLGGLELALVYTFNKFEKKDPMKCPGFE